MSFNSLGSLISLNVDIGGAAPTAAPASPSSPTSETAASSDSIQSSSGLLGDIAQLIQEIGNVVAQLGDAQAAATPSTTAQTGTSPATGTSAAATGTTSAATGTTSAGTGTASTGTTAGAATTTPAAPTTDPAATTAATDAATTAAAGTGTTDADTGTTGAASGSTDDDTTGSASGSTAGQSTSAPTPSASPKTQPASKTPASSASKKPTPKHPKHAKDLNPQERFVSVQVSSKGDPHEIITAKTAKGKSFTDRWNSMTAHATLLDSNSFGNSFRVSSEVTAPNAHGVTHNKSVSIDDGNTRVTMNNNGTYRVTSGDHVYTLSDDHPVHVGNGETITLSKDKSATNGVSLAVTQTGAHGAKLDATLEADHGGVNVSATGQNVDLGGYLVNGKHNTVDPDPKPKSTPKPVRAK